MHLTASEGSLLIVPTIDSAVGIVESLRRELSSPSSTTLKERYWLLLPQSSREGASLASLKGF